MVFLPFGQKDREMDILLILKYLAFDYFSVSA